MTKKGLAINVTVMLTVLLVMLIVVFLLSTVMKDMVYKSGGVFGMIPGTETIQLTDSSLEGKAVIECTSTITTEYKYTIKITELGLSYPEATVRPVFIFKGATATSVPAEVKLPGRLSFVSNQIRATSDARIVAPPSSRESVVMAFFKENAKCTAMAESGSSILREEDKKRLDAFVGECAKSMETVTTISIPVVGC